MTRLSKTCAAVAALALSAPALALAQDQPPSAEDACRALRTAMGSATFKATYGTNKNKSNAFGKCVSARAKATDNAADSARKACRSEQAADPTAFKNKYGTNRNKSNAFGKCVSAGAKATVDAQTKALANAAKRCKTERAADPTAFKNKYGTNRNKSNAFGKCVSQVAKTYRLPG